MTGRPLPSSTDLAASMLAAYNGGDMAKVLALGEPAANAESDNETVLLLLGLAQQSSQRTEAAVATFRRLTLLKPQTFEYWNNLAIVARQAGDMDAAERASLSATGLAPQNADVHYNLGLLYAQQQRWVLARQALLDAVRLEPGFIEARLQAAHACHVCGDNSGEESMLAGAADWPPQPAEQAMILATMLATQGDQQAAFHVLTRAVLPDGPSALFVQWRMAALRAALYERSNQTERAQAELSQLPLALLDALPAEHHRLHCEAWHAHAAVAARRGDTTQAAELYQRVLALTDEADMRANAGFGLASALNKQGRHKEAWQAAQTAHATQLDIAKDIVPELLAEGSQPLTMANDRVSHLEHDRWAPLSAPRDSESPVFVIGFPRSGTTLLEQMIDAHPDFRSMDERAFVYELTERMTLVGQHYPADLAHLTQQNVDQLRSIYADRVRKVVPDLGHRRLVDKNPLNMLCLPMIARLFPEARIIMCLRHPCDVLLSCYMQPFRSPAFMVLCSSLERLAHGYVQAFEHWYRHVEVFAPRVLEWRYESVVSRFDEHVVRLGHFLGIDDAAPMARFADHARSKGYISTPSYAQVTQGIHAKAVNRWHAYREMFEPVLPILRPMIERLGYDD
ncbi:tetratricopeptide repeat-containing sulfotransferase family protein [Dyella humicola]|uniref:tetratricopeptide repeat-containing sulfotransferase family protein n=1 Tax=Dyella humicola TaxID=2992126 RepID=UPI002252A8FC|nr:tetratricopeptide repeat-containing sulfotransferase family protein [Dyella humicola]